MVSGFELRVLSLGFKVFSLGSRVKGSEFSIGLRHARAGISRNSPT